MKKLFKNLFFKLIRIIWQKALKTYIAVFRFKPVKFIRFIITITRIKLFRRGLISYYMKQFSTRRNTEDFDRSFIEKSCAEFHINLIFSSLKNSIVISMDHQLTKYALKSQKIQGRNELCNCGSKMKYKYCCGK
jgi:hypothetical protein